jgi:peptidoglycan hydrolase-like protein with peptidoglycan-binding domain
MRALFFGSAVATVVAALPAVAEDFFADLQLLMQQGKDATLNAQPLVNAIGKMLGDEQQEQPPPSGNTNLAGLKQPSAPVAAPPTADSTLGGKDLKELQKLLAILAPVQGFAAPSADGKYGPRTRRAIEGFQAKNGLPVDGKATPATLQAAIAALQSISSNGKPAAESAPAPERAARPNKTSRSSLALAAVANTPDGSTLSTDALTQLFVGNTVYYRADVNDFEASDILLNPWGAADDMANRDAIKAYEHHVYFHPDRFYFNAALPLAGAGGAPFYEVGRYRIKQGTYFDNAMLCRNFRYEDLMQESCFIARKQGDEVHLTESTRRVMNYGEYLAYDEWGSWRDVEEHERNDQGYVELIALTNIDRGDQENLVEHVCLNTPRSMWEIFEKTTNAGGSGTGINPCLVR